MQVLVFFKLSYLDKNLSKERARPKSNNNLKKLVQNGLENKAWRQIYSKQRSKRDKSMNLTSTKGRHLVLLNSDNTIGRLRVTSFANSII